MIDHARDAVRSGVHGEFGGLIPVRPATGALVVCCAATGSTWTFTTSSSPTAAATACTPLFEVAALRKAASLWSGASPNARTSTSPSSTAPSDGLALVAYPPAAGTLAGRIGLQLDGAEVGTVTASPCAGCRTATLDYVHVAADYRRLGFGRTLVAAAVARAPSYKWTTSLPDRPVAQSFRGPGSRCAGPVSYVPTPVQLTSRSDYQRSKGESVVEELLQEVWQLRRQELVATGRERRG
ncbi:GNAT family N-acetyltransferase [Amycolatopsis sp. FBCC-B4732]|uniref:GNAT family N-acetyltransferase n=1 Tax=Amycolatopsis sp. FBCC-B4732 TaxID=3079339 RepID=UPI0037BFD5AF